MFVFLSLNFVLAMFTLTVSKLSSDLIVLTYYNNSYLSWAIRDRSFNMYYTFIKCYWHILLWKCPFTWKQCIYTQKQCIYYSKMVSIQIYDGWAYTTILHCHFILKCLQQARKVSDHVLGVSILELLWQCGTIFVSFSFHFMHVYSGPVRMKPKMYLLPLL